jgi:hypothetical protein
MKMILFQTIICFLLISCGISAKDEQAIAYDHYVVVKATENNADAVAYLSHHFKKRCAAGVVIMQGADAMPSGKSKIQFIDVVIEPELGSDYEIVKKENKLTFKANSKKTLYWLYYQYFQALSENDSKMEGADLPPAIISFKESKKGKFVFDYREPYLQANLEENYDIIVNTNNVEKDWGIWGHQLFNLINKNPKNAYYSIVDGQLNTNQLCFSNPATYLFLENYVIDNFGNKENNNQKFVISPADNGLVCTCSSCSKLGNSERNASFSVIALVNKMARKFPHHQFFTIDYISVKTPPVNQMPKNTGIIISAIDVPRKVNLDLNNPAVKEFESKVNRWRTVCTTVYVWEYISNFDDYLTPFATLSVCKSNFNFYKNLKVTGIFANGAGYDYSTFNAVHTYVLAALMQDPTLDINRLVNRYCLFYYGESGQMIADYILGLEKVMQTKNFKLNLYSGVKGIMNTYLNKQEFFDFYKAIEDVKNTDTEEIAFRMNQLHTGLMFSAMQINLASRLDEQFGFARLDANQIVVNNLFKNKYEVFAELFKINDIFITREREGSITNYLKDLQNEILNAQLQTNLLDKKTLKVTSALDEDYADASVLTDGIPALPYDYHNGWLITSGADLTAEINNFKGVGMFRFKINFLLDERLKMRAPEKIEIFINNKIVKTIQPTIINSDSPKRLSLETEISLINNDQLIIKIYRDKTYKKFACDEIFLYK